MSSFTGESIIVAITESTLPIQTNKIVVRTSWNASKRHLRYFLEQGSRRALLRQSFRQSGVCEKLLYAYNMHMSQLADVSRSLKSTYAIFFISLWSFF